MEKVIVNKEDLVSNINIVKKYIEDHSSDSNLKIIGVVKGNGYGLGGVELAKILVENGIDILAVSKVNEAIKLREEIQDKEILMLSSTAIEEEVELLVEKNTTLTLGSINSLNVLKKVLDNRQEKVNVHINIDTGFSRHGLHINELAEFITIYNNDERINITGIYTHFFESFAKNRKRTEEQYNILMEAVEIFKLNHIDNLMVHICNSSAVFKYPEYYLNAVRVGSAFVGKLAIENKYGLKRIGKLQTVVSEVKEIKSGSLVGYAGIYKAKKDMKIAIIQTGYSSGIGYDLKNNVWSIKYILRSIKHLLTYIKNSPKMNVEISNKKYNIVSNVRMNDIIVDITNSDVQVGDKVMMDIRLEIVDSEIKREYI